MSIFESLNADLLKICMNFPLNTSSLHFFPSLTDFYRIIRFFSVLALPNMRLSHLLELSHKDTKIHRTKVLLSVDTF